MSKELWEKEYGHTEGMATSVRADLSRSVNFFLRFADKNGIKLSGKVLDLGCGKGRNTIPLAEMGYSVWGMDISANALSKAEEQLKTKPDLRESVNLFRGSIGQPLPFPDNFFDLAMDITTFDILLDPKEIKTHAQEIHRVLKNRGYFIFYDMDKEDPYSLALPKDKKRIITDSVGIRYKTYSLDEVTKLFHKFLLVESEVFEFMDVMYGEEVGRKMICGIFQPMKT